MVNGSPKIIAFSFGQSAAARGAVRVPALDTEYVEWIRSRPKALTAGLSEEWLRGWDEIPA